MDKTRLMKLLKEAEEELAEAKAAMPLHSARPWQVQRLEDAEEKVEGLKRRLQEPGRD